MLLSLAEEDNGIGGSDGDVMDSNFVTSENLKNFRLLPSFIIYLEARKTTLCTTTNLKQSP